ncbi:deoxynucleoside kinase [Bradymonas sediminis]|uniref:Deoxynucleoside kinase n=1 Tax=Bradymonas sediminis TaxID=1548548 RepID=A0A2Z4FP48_9DELT|nr:deoxynucleoside kinase [Bradymonas sediminis]AWV90723.1 deoxynucleoside kinase [Bradymonas sediminis]TDP62636.1 deoxyadenosine/deoxycytidine kinase [Bradymonas sediminis]
MADALHITEIDRSQNSPRRAAQSNDPRRYIAVAGSIGAGKSSIVEFLSQHFDVQPFFEPNEDNPYLEDFYEDMERWSFHSQLYFLGAKFKLHKELDASPQNVIQDRTIWEDAEIFAQNLYQQGQMSARDWQTYRNLYESVQGEIRAPDVMIYLRCPVKTVRQRIAMRGREMEQNIPTEYLNRLHKLYENWIDAYDLSPLVILPTDKLDYVTNLVDYHEIVTVIEKYL